MSEELSPKETLKLLAHRERLERVATALLASQEGKQQIGAAETLAVDKIQAARAVARAKELIKVIDKETLP